MPQMTDFIQLISQLRHPEKGCPWDLKQNFQTMIPHLLEESYEVVEAIESKNTDNLKEELGDLLLQVVFLSQLAEEEGKFTFHEVLEGIHQKIIHRHPHVFGEVKAKNAEEALASWNAMKAQEASRQNQASLLDDLPQAFPALKRADKLQKCCAKVGFDWQHLPPVLEKVSEEWQEVQEEIHQTPQQKEKLQEELGDFLFATVNLVRHLGFDSEETLRLANQKFERRFRQVEMKVHQQNKKVEEMDLDTLDKFWDEVKLEEKK